MKKKLIFSGIRATGRLHLGNYLGAVKGMLDLQAKRDYKMIFAVVDVHAITTPYNKETLAKKTREVILDYLACGLDPAKSTLLVQSKVADLHCELAFYFSCLASIARMKHLPTFKEKVKLHPQSATMALLNYPLLMAADILAYKSELVPVGIDQEPHLEVAREIARKMNKIYGLHFPEPKRFATRGEYIPSLLGEGKMSKSVKNSYINLTDDLKTIKKRLAKTPTDIGQGKKVPPKGGVASLLKLVELFQGKEKREVYEKEYLAKGIKYQEVKENLAEAIYTELKPIQKKRKELKRYPDYVDQAIEKGALEARKIAKRTLEEVKTKMGFIS